MVILSDSEINYILIIKLITFLYVRARADKILRIPLDVDGHTLVTGDFLSGEREAVYAGRVYAFRVILDPAGEPEPARADAPYAYAIGAVTLVVALAFWLARTRRR